MIPLRVDDNRWTCVGTGRLDQWQCYKLFGSTGKADGGGSDLEWLIQKVKWPDKGSNDIATAITPVGMFMLVKGTSPIARTIPFMVLYSRRRTLSS